jgi:hypothetical protein
MEVWSFFVFRFGSLTPHTQNSLPRANRHNQKTVIFCFFSSSSSSRLFLCQPTTHHVSFQQTNQTNQVNSWEIF